MSENKWQPIETAPRDGTDVLLYGGTILQDTRGGWGPNTGMVASWEKARFNDQYGYWSIFDSDGKVSIAHPTHWQPLPDPPQ